MDARIFRFVVRHLHGLAHVPLLPHGFDAALLTWTALFHRRRLSAMEAIESEALQIPEISPCRHRFGGLGFATRGVEFAHLHGNGLLDVQLTRERGSDWIQQGVAEAHHVFGLSSWVSFWVRDERSVPAALQLLKEGAQLKGSLPGRSVETGLTRERALHPH